MRKNFLSTFGSLGRRPFHEPIVWKDDDLAGVNQSSVDLVPELAEDDFIEVKVHHPPEMMSSTRYTESDDPFRPHEASYCR
jgi:hypothetical protein